MRRAGVALALVCLLVAAPTRAWADGGTDATGGGASNPTIGVSSPGSSGGGSEHRGGGIVKCYYQDASLSSGGSPEVISPEPGKRYYLVCFDAASKLVYAAFVNYDPATAAVDPATLARQAWSELPLVFPAAQTSPETGRPQYVGLATWLWVDPGSWRPLTATAQVPGLSATVTATPSRVEWDMGDGRVETCGAGTPYDNSRAARDQSTNCSHTFTDASSTRSDGRFHATATMWWTVTWVASDGSSGTLPAAFRSTRFDLVVDEIQALRQGGQA